MKIREMISQDLIAVARVNVDTFRETQSGIVPDQLINTLSYESAARRFQRLLDKEEQRSTIFVAEDCGAIVGYAMGGRAREPVAHYEGELYGIYILPQYHGTGVGRRLMSVMARYLTAQRIYSMFVVVFSANLPAIKFYEALGGKKCCDRTMALHGWNLKEAIYGWDSLNELCR